MLFFIDDFGVGLTDSARPPPTAREIDDFGVGLTDSASPPPTASEIDDFGAGLTDSARWPSQLSSGRASESVLGALFAPRAIFAHLALLHHAWRAHLALFHQAALRLLSSGRSSSGGWPPSGDLISRT